MSFPRTDRHNSTASSNGSPSLPPNDDSIDPSNMLYNDRQNYQIIFSNDSRFFDTSLHLFESYRDRGYVEVEKKKSKKKPSYNSNNLKPSSNGFNGRWRPRTSGFSSNNTNQRNSNGLTNTPSFLRNRNDSSSQQSDSGSSRSMRIKRENSPLVVSHEEKPIIHERPITHSDSSDEPDVIVTRL